MILIKKKHLYTLVILVCILLVFGEVRFFLALKSVNLAANLEVKYEVESFIFASIVMILIVYLFLVFFMRRSDNVLKRLDKMIELSEYGEYDISAHLKKLDMLGQKIENLLYYFKDLNEMKTLRISSLSAIVNLLMQQSTAPVFLFNRHGDMVNCSDSFLVALGAPREAVMNLNVNSILKGASSADFFIDVEDKRTSVVREEVAMEIDGNSLTRTMELHPVVNAKGDISHIAGILVPGITS
ncbi:MAG: PAS domain-containing protein [Deltaproteobacteria bacterium]|nr:PAS domain-containing protein [Deltaproteobacteria bacterium]